jgi:hypothetical protein
MQSLLVGGGYMIGSIDSSGGSDNSYKLAVAHCDCGDGEAPPQHHHPPEFLPSSPPPPPSFTMLDLLKGPTLRAEGSPSSIARSTE